MELVRAVSDLTDDDGIALAEPTPAKLRRADYALAAGSDRGQRSPGGIARGTSSLDWSGVPPAVFDAAEDTIDWRVEAAGPVTNVIVGVELSGTGSAGGIAVRLRSGAFSGAGALDPDGRASFPLIDAQLRPITESAAWDHDWGTTAVTVGADVQESPQTRERIRDFARGRLAEPARDAFLAEILAAEADY